MNPAPALKPVRCRFDNCSSLTIARIVVAVVDQVAAEADADMALLEALDDPISVGFEALERTDIDTVEVSVVDDSLLIDIDITRDIADIESVFGNATDDVDTFFDIVLVRPDVVRLTGPLR